MSPKHLRFTWSRIVLNNQDTVQTLQVVLSIARRASPAALSLLLPTALIVLHRDPPDVIFKRISMTVWTYVRQCDPSLSFSKSVDPSQRSLCSSVSPAAVCAPADRPPVLPCSDASAGTVLIALRIINLDNGILFCSEEVNSSLCGKISFRLIVSTTFLSRLIV